MSEASKCPFCGSSMEMVHSNIIIWDCGTRHVSGTKIKRSRLCWAQEQIEALRNPPSYRKMDMSDKDYIRSLEQRLAQTEKPE